MKMLDDDLGDIRARKWNSERFIVFQMVILQKSKEVKTSGAIRRQLTMRMDSWEAKKFEMLVQDTERTALAQLARVRGVETQEQRAKTFARLVLQGKLRSAVRWLTDREKGGVLLPDDVDEKTGESVIDVLQSKHPDAQVPDAAELEDYETVPNFVDLDITKEVVEKVARRLSGSAGPGGSDAQSLQQWLLRFGAASQRLRKAVCEIVDWMANDFPPWAAYRALKAGRLVAFNKCPDVQPVGIGESWNRLNAQCVMLISGGEAKDACGVEPLRAGLEAGIEGSLPAIRLLSALHASE